MKKLLFSLFNVLISLGLNSAVLVVEGKYQNKNLFVHNGFGAGGIGFGCHHLGAKKIILLGYDCKYASDGKRHFFGDHPPGMNGNAGSLRSWPGHFRSISVRFSKKCDIVNCSRDTALTDFRRANLEDVLNAT